MTIESKGMASTPPIPDTSLGAEPGEKITEVAFAWVGYQIPPENTAEFDTYAYLIHKGLGLIELGADGLEDAAGYRRPGDALFVVVGFDGNEHEVTRITVAAYESKAHRNAVDFKDGPGKIVLDHASAMAERLGGSLISIREPVLPEDAEQFLQDTDPRIEYPVGQPAQPGPAI